MEDKSKRKSTRGFNLEKPKKRTFNLEKETESTVRPSIGAMDDSADKHKQVTPTIEATNDTSVGGKKWIVLLVVVLLIVALRGCGKDEISEPMKAPVENVEDSTQKEKPDTSSSQEQTQATGNTEQADAPLNEQGAQAGINNVSSVSSASSPAGHRVDEMAKQVWDGVYGNGAERKAKLGSDYVSVQKRVNEMYRNGYRH